MEHVIMVGGFLLVMVIWWLLPTSWKTGIKIKTPNKNENKP